MNIYNKLKMGTLSRPNVLCTFYRGHLWTFKGLWNV